jgi:hypothetical protein
MSFKISGTLKVKNDTVQVSEKFSKREFVITDSASMYPQDIQFQLTQDKCSLLDGYNPGEQIEVSFNLRGREWVSPQGETKYFNTIEAWRIEKVSAAGTPAPNAMSSNPVSEPHPFDLDDLPF